MAPPGCVARAAQLHPGSEPGALVLCYQRLRGPGAGGQGGLAATGWVQLREEAPSPAAGAALVPGGLTERHFLLLGSRPLQPFRPGPPRGEELNQRGGFATRTFHAVPGRLVQSWLSPVPPPPAPGPVGRLA